MATFEAQVEALTSIDITSTSTPNQAELSQFLVDGVLDVTSKWIAVRPNENGLFQRVTSALIANDTTTLNGAQIVSIVREDGNTVNRWNECRFIQPSLQHRVTDTTSIHYSSRINPSFTILENGIINVYPAPAASPNRFKVYYVNHEPMDASGGDLTYSDSDIKFFPKDKVLLVSLYAAIKTIEAKLADYSVTEEDTELVQSLMPTLQSLKVDYNGSFLPTNVTQVAQQRRRAGE
jgi:hypothetical protein|tara:strand:+ start:801 stop:1505 length:705 start_codon:yes stop_codon:yes gene_type:complete